MRTQSFSRSQIPCRSSPREPWRWKAKMKSWGTLEGEGRWGRRGFLRSMVLDPPGMTFVVAKSASSFDVFIVEPNFISTRVV